MLHLLPLRSIGVATLLTGCTLVGGFNEERLAEEAGAGSPSGSSSEGPGGPGSSSGSGTSEASTGTGGSGAGSPSSSTSSGGGDGGAGGEGAVGTGGDGGDGASGGRGPVGGSGPGSSSSASGASSGGGEGGEGPAPRGVWPDSPTTYCSDGSGPVVPCPADDQPYGGQDGAVVGVIARYEVEAEVVTDPTTGLTWQLDALDPGLDWDAAELACVDLELAGATDWRLPSMRELASLWDAGAAGFRIDQAAFPSPDLTYWTSTRLGPDGRQHAVLRFDDTVVVANQSSGEPGIPAARCVRGEPHLPIMVVAVDTVLDESTGLMWELDPSNSDRSWANALGHCQGLTVGGFDDWRLPSMKEMVTIIDPARRPAVLDTFTSWTADYRWTSTPSLVEEDFAHLFVLGIYESYSQTIGFSTDNDTTSAFFRGASCVRDAR